MTKPQFSTIEVGDILPALTFPPINRTTLFLFGGASGDYNPIHIDIDFARKSGMPDVFAHGMLGMAYLGRLLDTVGRSETDSLFQRAFFRHHPPLEIKSPAPAGLLKSTKSMARIS